ncbi:uncharacterized protein LOC142048977 [Phalacrocorax aristotelis]|uniref:uncharacterized protein LOC142048977 n=1 Tax=Phalacrocorax aristotelis TaxID=126867 RepID=UPI003F4C815E
MGTQGWGPWGSRHTPPRGGDPGLGSWGTLLPPRGQGGDPADPVLPPAAALRGPRRGGLWPHVAVFMQGVVSPHADRCGDPGEGVGGSCCALARACAQPWAHPLGGHGGLWASWRGWGRDMGGCGPHRDGGAWGDMGGHRYSLGAGGQMGVPCVPPRLGVSLARGMQGGREGRRDGRTDGRRWGGQRDGRSPPCCRFHMNLARGPAWLHGNPRFGAGGWLVLSGGRWEREQRRGLWPFAPGTPCELIVTVASPPPHAYQVWGWGKGGVCCLGGARGAPGARRGCVGVSKGDVWAHMGYMGSQRGYKGT